MILNFEKSLSKKILINFLLIFLIITLSVFFAIEEVGRLALKKVERQKAEVMLDTILPSLSTNLYLGFYNKIEHQIEDIVKNQKSILKIDVLKDDKVIISKSKEELKSIEDDNYFKITKPIYKPNSKDVMGRVLVIYSYENYKKLLKEYEKLLLIFFVLAFLLFLIFSIYLRQLFAPLKEIAVKLKNYSAKEPLKFSLDYRKDEIGAISKALEEMQKKIIAYNKRQEDINKYLEKVIQDKTQELRNGFFKDSLTSLPNRFKLQEDLEKFPEATLVVVNIDDFKEINDFFGHKIGDEILKLFAKKLLGFFKDQEYPKVYRISADEFVLLFNKKMEDSKIIKFVNALHKNIEQMVFSFDGKDMHLRVTMGIYSGSEQHLEKADIALKKAKQTKRSFEIYKADDKKVEEQYRKNIEWIKRLKKAIELDRVVPFFQPIVSVNTLEPKGYESLVRILDEDGRPISPGEFLEIAKKSRLYFTLTKRVVQKSCELFANSSCSFSINLSIEDILNEDIKSFLEETIKKYKVSNRIVLEVVESEGVENYELVSKFLFKMKELGCQIAIDDFGSGYSNFEHILNLPVDYIKIDGSLIKNIVTDRNSQIIVGAIVDIAQKKDVKTVAEFVSSEEIFNLVKELGVDYVQGFYFGKPEPDIKKECLKD